jgi:hypothetical protein
MLPTRMSARVLGGLGVEGVIYGIERIITSLQEKMRVIFPYLTSPQFLIQGALSVEKSPEDVVQTVELESGWRSLSVRLRTS